MQTIEEVKVHCRDVGERIEKAVADGLDLGEYFELGGDGPRKGLVKRNFVHSEDLWGQPP